MISDHATLPPDDPAVPRGHRRAPVGAKPPNPLVKEPTETKVWMCSDGTTKTRLQDAQAHELALSFQQLVRPYERSGYNYDQPIPLPNGLRDRDDLWRWIQEYGHKLFPWLGVYVATVPEPRQGIAVEERS